MRPLRILLIANTLPPRDVSGVGEQVLQLAAGLTERGHEVTVMGRGPDGARGPKLLFPLTAVPAARKAVRRLRPHVVQVHESDGALVALWLRRAGRRLEPPPLVAALLQVSYREERRAVRALRDPAGRVLGRPGVTEIAFRWLKAPLQVALGRLTARLAGVVLAPSAATAAELERDYLAGAGRGRVAVVPNVTGGLPVPPAAPPAPLDGGPAETPGYLLFVGRLRLRKGVEVLLEALARLPGARLLIAGDGEHRAALEARTAALGLGGAVRFLGRASAGRVQALLAGARALVVPSIYEGMPLVVLEAMAAGVPVVASRVSGIPEVVDDPATGWLVLPEDPSCLARALGEALADEAAARRRGAAGRLKVARTFTPAAAAAAWEEAVSRYLS